jgi:hypothetical protein
MQPVSRPFWGRFQSDCSGWYSETAIQGLRDGEAANSLLLHPPEKEGNCSSFIPVTSPLFLSGSNAVRWGRHLHWSMKDQKKERILIEKDSILPHLLQIN